MTIRSAENQDLQYLITGTLSLHQHEQIKTPNLHVDFEKNMTRWISHCITNPNQLCLIYEDNNNKQGFLIGEVTIAGDGLVVNPLIGKILVLWVDTDFREKGIARQLVSEFQTSCNDVGVGSLECQHTPNNRQATHFWQKMGFEIVAYQCQKVLPINELTSQADNDSNATVKDN